MKKQIVLFAVATLILTGCTKNLPESSGTVVTLTAEDKSYVSWAVDYMQPWAAWHLKGTHLANDGRYEEALYCFHQALDAWPKKLPDSATSIQKKTYNKESTDTLLQLGYLYLKMDKPELALEYFQKFNNYLPYDNLGLDGIKQAKDLMKK